MGKAYKVSVYVFHIMRRTLKQLQSDAYDAHYVSIPVIWSIYEWSVVIL